MSSKIINVNFNSVVKEGNKSKHESIARLKLKRTKYEYERYYETIKKLEGFFSMKKEYYEQSAGWSIFFLCFAYVAILVALLSEANSFFIVALTIPGVFYIFGLSGRIKQFYKGIKFRYGINKLTEDKKCKLKELVCEKIKIEASIKCNTYIEKKYLHRYIEEDNFRKLFFFYMEEYINNNNVEDIDDAAKYALRQINKINVGLKYSK